jgi:sugar lactone lactonase YvrE
MSFDFNNISWRGDSLVRPECVLATAAGYLYVSDFRGGVTEIAADGTQTFFGGQHVEGIGLLKPNGIALLENGDFLIAHLGDSQGGIFRISREGHCSTYISEVDGVAMEPSNFIYLDYQGRLWITVSTTVTPRADAYRKDIGDGYIAVIENGVARKVADGLGYTNEVYVDPDGEHLYVNATFSRELIRFDISADSDYQNNQLTNPQVIANFPAGTFPDGLTRDQEGNFWVTSIVSNRIIKVTPNGEQQVVLQDNDAQHMDWVEEAFQTGQMGRPHLDDIKSECLKSTSSLAFSGPGLSVINLGCLLDQKIPSLDSRLLLAQGAAGCAPAHWHFDDNR